MTTKKGTEITTTTDEAATERILLEPFVTNTEGFDEQKTIKGMKHEVGQMKTQQVYTVKYDDLTPEEQSNIIESKWVFRGKTTEVRARIVAKGFAEVINSLDSVYASTPMFLHSQDPPHSGTGTILGCSNRRHNNSISSRCRSNMKPLHVATSRILQRSRSERLEAQQGDL